ncbi:hypothetical protein AO263_34610 [Pseudomonas sp. NZIPFR-PS5]|nr:hypothetical protein AO263_34610 [Pseudomonas sp. NZIPFR-PS5]
MTYGLHEGVLGFAKALGFRETHSWSRKLKHSLKLEWRAIKRMEIIRMNELDNFFRSVHNGQGAPRSLLFEEQMARVRAMYPNIPTRGNVKPRRGDITKPVKIGLGMESSYKPRKIDRQSVLLDQNTTTKFAHDKSILYTAGWSIDGAFASSK